MESSLSLKYQDYINKVAFFLGWSTGVEFIKTDDNLREQVLLDECVASGIRQFYYPPAMPGGFHQGQQTPYEWSFLRPIATLTLVSGEQTIRLPDDFGGCEGEITVASAGTTTVPWPIRFFNEGMIREAYAKSPTASGPPTMAALVPIKGTTAIRSSRQDLSFFPIADQNYTVQFQYELLGEMLTGTNPYVYGGAAHVETILESCLSIAEQRIDDMSGVHTMKFHERLEASIAMDRRNKPAVMGYNGDRSDNRHMGRAWAWNIPRGTYNGQSYD